MTSATPELVKANNSSNTKADRLVLVNLSAQPCEAWLDAVSKAGQTWHKEVVDNLAKVKVLLKEHPRAHVLVCYDAPYRQVAGCIANQRLPSQALANWLSATEALLDLYRDNFERMTLVRREALEQNTKELFPLLASRSGIALGRVAVKSEKNQGATDDKEQAIQHLLASRALQHQSAEPLAKELEASSLPLGSSTELLEFLDSTYDILKQSTGSSAEYEQLKTRLEDVQQENDLVIEQLHKTQEALEQYLLSNKDSAQKNKQLTSQLAAARQQLKVLRSSKSWKVTAPLRKGMKILGGKKGGGA